MPHLDEKAKFWEALTPSGSRPLTIDDFLHMSHKTSFSPSPVSPLDDIPPGGLQVRVYGRGVPAGMTECIMARNLSDFRAAYSAGREYRICIQDRMPSAAISSEIAATTFEARVYQVKLLRISGGNWNACELVLVEPGYRPPFALSVTYGEIYI